MYVPVEKAEEIILYYTELVYLLRRGLIPKITIPLQIKARELGFGIATAWRIIRYARDVGAVDRRIISNLSGNII